LILAAISDRISGWPHTGAFNRLGQWPKDQGGQKWFHLYPYEQIKHDDVLHWTRLNQNWNFMCAECHSTGVKKNYDAANDRFRTTWAEISVGCEACHGKGSRHVNWAHNQRSWFEKDDDPRKGLAILLNERDGITWQLDPKTGNPQRSVAPAVTRREVETCGLCHARRGEFSEEWVPGQPLSDTHAVSLLARGLYHADGQMRDEVYNYGPFKQSKMFAAGVTCSDCHEPHAAKLRAPGNGVCLQCHASDKYEVASHNRHEGVSPAVTCASCHMPVSTYMVVDKRHDHSLRIPRSLREAWHPQCLQRLPCRQIRTMGGRRDRALARSGPESLPELRRGVPGFLDQPSRRGDATRYGGGQCHSAGDRACERS
jgi:predicted CXXCH cytochrome family protein